MERIAYILDTNTATDFINNHSDMTQRIFAAKQRGYRLILCQPVDYEIVRGLLKINSARKLDIYQKQFVPLLEWLPLVDVDWRQAASFWSSATKVGRQISDIDLLVAALAYRIKGIVITSDQDFVPLPIKTENWRKV